MKATIFSHKDEIGTTLLEVSDGSMGVLSGVFIPNENYESIREKIWAFNNDIGTRNFELIEALRLNVQLENGYFLFALGGISILDLEELKDEPIRIDVAGVFRHVIEDYFENLGPDPILQEPWGFISIEQKIAFEDELKKELGVDNGKELFGFLKNQKESHSLKNVEVSALANSGMNDEVLFAINNPELALYFALVNLNWNGKREPDPKWPRTQYYKSFDEFKYNKMFPDKIEWES